MSSGSPPKRRAAKRIKRRDVTATIDAGDFEGWTIHIWADFPAKDLAALQSGDVGKILAVLERIVIDHNLPNDAGDVATELGDVDYTGLLKVAEAAMDAIQRLPPR